MKALRTWVAVLAAVFLLSSCGYQILQKPQQAKGKKLALVSIFGNRAIRDISGRGSITGVVSAFGSSSEKGDKGEQEEKSRFMANRLLTFAAKAYAEELGAVPGWTVVPLSEARKNPAYRDFNEKLDLFYTGNTFFKKMLDFSVVTPEGVPMVMGDARGVTTAAAALAKSLQVDIVVALEMDFAYEIRSFLGVGTARPIVGAAIWFYDRKGEMIGATPWERATGDNAFRNYSQESITQALGIVPLTPEHDSKFQDSIQKGAQALVEKLREELQ